MNCWRPFYLEDTDIGYLAWKRGWKVLYEPASKVWHEHRGTIGRKFSQEYIDSVLKKNFLLFVWKNIHSWRRMAEHLVFSWTGAAFSLLVESSGAHHVRRHPAGLPATAGRTGVALARPVAGGDRRHRKPSGVRRAATFATDFFRRPIPMAGCVWPSPRLIPSVRRCMAAASSCMEPSSNWRSRCEVHALVNMEYPSQMEAHQALQEDLRERRHVPYCQPYAPPEPASTLPYAIREFREREMAYLLNRIIYLNQIDVVQLEYTVFGQYAGDYQHVAVALFEHDVSFQAIARGYRFIRQPIARVKATWEYLRMIRYELRLASQVRRGAGLHAREPAVPGVVSARRCAGGFRKGCAPGSTPPSTISRAPRASRSRCCSWATSATCRTSRRCSGSARSRCPRIVERYPQTRVIVAGADPPPLHTFLATRTGVLELPGLHSGYPAAAAAKRGVHLSGAQRVRRAGQTAGSVRQRDSGGVDLRWSGRTGPEGW